MGFNSGFKGLIMYCHIWSRISFERMGWYLQLTCVWEWQAVKYKKLQYPVCRFVQCVEFKCIVPESYIEVQLPNYDFFFLRLAVKKNVLKSIACLSGSDVSVCVSCNRSNMQSTCVLYPWARCPASSDWQLFATFCYAQVQHTCLRL